MLVNQEKNNTCQKVNWLWPSRGWPVQMRSFAASQKSRIEWTPSWGYTLNFPEFELRYLGRLKAGTEPRIGASNTPA